ncbi:YcaO-related McrA-glycine thioamidation protein [Micromonospora sonneratiae]|uniref:YcaO-like family protein n=1 Tax=Micromonospora sonneratiae TaxID=1184706 RepID=A0ABW3YE21_9ACTN
MTAADVTATGAAATGVTATDCPGGEVADPVVLSGAAYRARKQFRYGTHRVVEPEETLNGIRPHFARVGLTRVATITHLDRIGIPVTLAIRPNSPTMSNSSGKGFTLAAAKTSAAMEAIEIWHAENVRLPEIRATYDEIANGHHVIPRDRLALARNSLFNTSWPYRWTMAWDIVNQVQVPVPVAAVDLAGRRSLHELGSFQLSSNGLASGNHTLEAVTAALYEVIERDAVTCQRLAWASFGAAPPRVRLETITDPLVCDLLERFRAARVVPVIFDCTVDTGVPVYLAIIYDEQARQFGIYRGQGAHLDPAIAMIRALTEAAQGRVVYIAGSRDDMFRDMFARLKRQDDAAMIARLTAVPETVDASIALNRATSTFEGDIQLVVQGLGRLGLDQVLVLDLSRDDFPINVVKVIVPGLEGYMLGNYAPGPRALSFLAPKARAAATTESGCEFRYF